MAFGGYEVGRTYNRRRDIHGRFGGQRQGGICTPKDYPVVIAFTGTSGRQHGYADGWAADGVYRYFGEGQSGDMSWKGGNLAIRDHAANGEDLLLFQTLWGWQRPLASLPIYKRSVDAPSKQCLRPRRQIEPLLSAPSMSEAATFAPMSSRARMATAKHARVLHRSSRSAVSRIWSRTTFDGWEMAGQTIRVSWERYARTVIAKFTTAPMVPASTNACRLR